MKKIALDNTGQQVADLLYANDLEAQARRWAAGTYELNQLATVIIDGAEHLFRSKITANTAAPTASDFKSAGNWTYIGGLTLSNMPGASEDKTVSYLSKVNVIAGAATVDGKYLSATNVPSNGAGNFYTADIIPVVPGSKVVVDSAGSITLLYYDKNGAFLGYLGVTPDQATEREFTLPITAYGIRYNGALAKKTAGTAYLYVTVYGKSLEWLATPLKNVSGAVPSTTYNFDNINRADTFPNSGYIDGSGVVKALSTYSYTDLTAIPAGTTIAKLSFASVYGVAFYKADGTFISTLGSGGGPDVFGLNIPIPAGATQFRYMINTVNKPNAYIYFGTSTTKYTLTDLIYPAAAGSKWQGKKIFYCGTSIPAGYPKQSDQNTWSYANKAAIAVGATINNVSVPNGLIRSATSSGGSMGSRDTLSFTRLASPVNYKVSMLDLIGTANEPDLFIFDYGPNDYDQDKSDIDAYASFDMTSEDTTKFLGAYNFVFKQLYTKKIRARVAIVTHYSNDSTSAGIASWYNLNKAIERLADYWEIPILRIYEKTGWVKKNGINVLATMTPDGIHPASMADTYSVDELADILTAFLKTF